MRIVRERVTLAEIHEELAAFESEHRAAMPEFERTLRTHLGPLFETPEFAHWSSLRSAVKLAESRQRTTGSPVC